MFLLTTPINISNEKNVQKKVHIGYTAGITTSFYEVFDYASLEVHGTFNFMTRTGNNHFESKLGFAFSPIIIYEKYEWTDYSFPIIPVVSLGYRHQKPDSNKFLRIFVSTGGIGWGYLFKDK